MKFDDEGGSASNNLRVVTEEDLKIIETNKSVSLK